MRIILKAPTQIRLAHVSRFFAWDGLEVTGLNKGALLLAREDETYGKINLRLMLNMGTVVEGFADYPLLLLSIEMPQCPPDLGGREAALQVALSGLDPKMTRRLQDVLDAADISCELDEKAPRQIDLSTLSFNFLKCVTNSFKMESESSKAFVGDLLTAHVSFLEQMAGKRISEFDSVDMTTVAFENIEQVVLALNHGILIRRLRGHSDIFGTRYDLE